MVCTDAAAVAEEAAAWVAAASRRAIADRGSCSIALAGGSTPRLLYDLLAGPDWRDRVDWSAWHVFFGDERACPPGDESSNFHIAATTLLSRVPVEAVRVHRMPADRADLDAAAAEYSALLATSLPIRTRAELRASTSCSSASARTDTRPRSFPEHPRST